jgi:hypothetical protein
MTGATIWLSHPFHHFSRQLEGNLSEKISNLKQTTVKSLGEPDALNPRLVIGSLLIHLFCLVLICFLTACPLSPPTSCYCPFFIPFQEWRSHNVTLLWEMVQPSISLVLASLSSAVYPGPPYSSCFSQDMHCRKHSWVEQLWILLFPWKPKIEVFSGTLTFKGVLPS